MNAFRRLCLALLGSGLLLAAVGCASEKNQRINQLSGGNDPLLGKKISPPNVPTGRDQYGLKDGRDPLLRADAGRTDPEFSDLRIPTPTDRRPTGGYTGLSTSGTTSSADHMSGELQRVGAKVFAPNRTETGSYEVRVQVPHSASGAMTGYVGSGNTPTLALKDAYDQVRADRK